MKISEIRTFVTWGDPRNWVFVKVMTDEGVYGWGEATVEGKERTVEAAVHELGKWLVGEDPARIEHHWQRLYRHGFWRGGIILNSALAALDQALWDIAGKVASLPVYRLFGGPTRDRVRLYSHVGIYDPDRMIDDAQAHVAEGFTAMKTGAWQSDSRLSDRDLVNAFVGRVERLREAVGPDVDIMIDNHGRSRPSAAIRLMRAMEPLDLYFFEEPTPPDNLDALAKVVAAGFDMDIAAGERLFSKWEFRELLERQLVDIVQPDLCHCGGLTEARKIAALAETYYVQVAPHSPQGPISTAACAHLAASIPNFAILEFVHSQPWRNDVQREPLVVRNGHLELPTRPGLGVDLDEEMLARNPYRERAPRSLAYAADGAVADV
jgi:galactonate dehydratase